MITRIEFPDHVVSRLGIKPGTLERLGPVVVLAGPNGSGKSRYLKTIPSVLQELGPNMGGTEVIEARIGTLAGRPGNPEVDRLRRVVQARKATLLTQLAPQCIHLEYRSDLGIASDPDSSSTEREQNAKQVDQNFATAYAGMHCYLGSVARSLFASEHPRTKHKDGLRARIDDANGFNKILDALLGTKVDFDLNDAGEPVALLRGRPFVANELSHGERVLINWAIALHRQSDKLKDAIVLIDEPELHLHPAACICALERLRNTVLGEHGQIWLATHSVPLVAYGGVESLFLVKDNDIRFAGNDVPAVIEALVGGGDNRERLSTFLQDADSIRFVGFALQCVFPSGIAEPREGDPQERQFTRMVRDRLGKGEKLRILDYGAGKGRFATALRDMIESDAGTGLRGRVSYVAYNDGRHVDAASREACKERVVALGGIPDEAYFESWADLKARLRSNSVDLVVLANVLHEVPPDEWLMLAEQAREVLSPDGYLLVMEDLLPSVGELPHWRGYLVLNEVALGVLFGCSKEAIRVDDQSNPRLVVVAVPCNRLQNVTNETRKAALQYVRNRAMERIKEIRSGSATSTQRSGREHAFLTVLFANATLALQAYDEPNKKTALV